MSRGAARALLHPRGDSYQVVPELRQMVVFAQHNVIKDAPFTRVDLITCRNLLIYLQPPVQQKVLSLFHFALNRGGVLFLGPSESPGALARDFETVDEHWRIYRKHSDVRAAGRRAHPALGAARCARRLPRCPPAGRALRAAAAARAPTTPLLDEFMPPSLLVNERGELVHALRRREPLPARCATAAGPGRARPGRTPISSSSLTGGAQARAARDRAPMVLPASVCWTEGEQDRRLPRDRAPAA